MIPAVVREPAPELERLRADVTAHLGDFDRLARAREDEQRRDLTLLRSATGWDARLLALAADTVALARETGISADALYAAARTGLPRTAEALAAVSTATFREALRKAERAGIAQLGKDAQAAGVAAFEQFTSRARLTRKAPGTLSTLDQLLEGAADAGERLSADERAAFAGLLVADDGGGRDLWKAAAKAGIAPAKVEALRAHGKLAYLTHNNGPLASSLQRDARGRDDLSWLVERDFHKPETWKAQIEKLAAGGGAAVEELIPPAYGGSTTDERLAAYAGDLAAKVRESFPTQVVARMVSGGEVAVGASKAERERVGTFLKRAGSLGFELGREPLHTFAERERERLFPAADEAKAAEATLRQAARLARLYQITPTDGSLAALAAGGFESAWDVVAFRPDAFVEHHGSAFPSRREAELTYAKAQQVRAVTQNVVVMAAGVGGTPLTQVTASTQQAVQQAQASLIRRFPTMESLFGSLDFCECEHCRSVLSPAAYLVDLLQFLDPEPRASGTTS